MSQNLEPVDLFRIRFPRLDQRAAIQLFTDKFSRHETVGVCFADMSTLNLAYRLPHFHRLLQSRLITLNDGAGLELIARFRGKPFPDNLNGTDLTPQFMRALPAGAKVFLLGGYQGVSLRAKKAFTTLFPQLDFVGAADGYFDQNREEEIVQILRQAKPQLVLVALGNPLQVEFIDRRLDDPSLQGIMWWAVGGFLDFYGGNRPRAPEWMIRCRLEWLHIIYAQPYKLKRYLLGIPRFFWNSLWLALQRQHGAQP